MVVIDPFSLGIAAVSSGLGFFGKQQESRQAMDARNRAIRLQNRQARESTRLQNLMIADRNRYAAEEYETRVGLYNKQREFNQQAANLAYQSEQQRLNEVLQQSAFRRQGMRQQLLEAQGANIAMSEGRGRSFERAAALSTSGAFGRSSAQLAEGTRAQQRQSRATMRRISQQQYAQDLAGFANVAMRPYMQRQLPAPMQIPQQRSSGFNTMLQIGNAALGGIQAYGALAPPAAGNLPFNTGGVGGNFNTQSMPGIDYGSFNVTGL
jgi:hypothetical protein